jgi:SAM-dependent methyltransferase
MTDLPDPVAWYDAHAGAQAVAYEGIDPARLYSWLTGLLPAAPALVLDVGAGSGRDAVWLARLGHDVVAVEPSAGLRAEAARYHGSTNVRWVADRLPALPGTLRLGLAFDLILLSGVWQHVIPAERARALRKLLGLLRPGGVLAVTLRQGPAEAARAMHPVSLTELERLARECGAMVIHTAETPDQMGRPDVTWTGIALRLPDDGTGALPLLRHVILNDQKSATYKLGLLRALCRAADGQAGFARERGEDSSVVLPLGLIALDWVRLYLPLVAAGLPQAPSNAGPDGLGFAGPGFRALLCGLVPRLDLRVGARFAGEAAQAVRSALQEAADLIARMPATYMTYPNGGPVLPTVRRRARGPHGEIVLDAEFLAGFGTLEVPRELWRAVGRFAVWIEPALVAEWCRLMRAYAGRQQRRLDEDVMAAAMTWSEPSRDVVLPRQRALYLLEAGAGLRCVWSGRGLDARSLDMDHCLPWSAWPCGDLWNLLPAHRAVNQHQKRERLPADALLRAAGEPIQDWWRRAYLQEAGSVLPRRFADEARASLPGLMGITDPPPEEVFAALLLQRLRLRHDQQVPEWTSGGRTSST